MVASSGHGYPIGYGHTMVIRNASLKFQRVRDIHPSLIIYRRVRVCSPIDTVYFTQSPWPFSLSTHLEGHSFILHRLSSLVVPRAVYVHPISVVPSVHDVRPLYVLRGLSGSA